MFSIISIGNKFVAPEHVAIGLLTIDDKSAGQVLLKCCIVDSSTWMSGNTCQGATISCRRGGNVKFLWSTYLVVNLKQLEEQPRKVDEREQVPRSDNKLPKRGKDGVGAGTSCKGATKSC
ncbi:hypothetical protein Tco_1448685 [Tanacetum coccineum]